MTETKKSRLFVELSERITSMAPHEKLPKEVELADELSVSRSTLRQVLASLVASGLIYSVRGSGNFVSGTKITKDAALSGFSEDMRARGMVPGSVLVFAKPDSASEGEAISLGLQPGALVYRIKRLRTADGLPMCIENVTLPAERSPGLLARDLTGGLYELLRREYGIEVAVAEQTISCAVASDDEAEMLGMAKGDPVMVVRRLGRDARGMTVEQAESCYRGDRYEFRLLATRTGRE